MINDQDLTAQAAKFAALATEPEKVELLALAADTLSGSTELTKEEQAAQVEQISAGLGVSLGDALR